MIRIGMLFLLVLVADCILGCTPQNAGDGGLNTSWKSTLPKKSLNDALAKADKICDVTGEKWRGCDSIVEVITGSVEGGYFEGRFEKEIPEVRLSAFCIGWSKDTLVYAGNMLPSDDTDVDSGTEGFVGIAWGAQVSFKVDISQLNPKMTKELQSRIDKITKMSLPECENGGYSFDSTEVLIIRKITGSSQTVTIAVVPHSESNIYSSLGEIYNLAAVAWKALHSQSE